VPSPVAGGKDDRHLNGENQHQYVLENSNDVLTPPLVAAGTKYITCDGRLNGVENAQAIQTQHPNRYHPVTIGDYLHDRYRIVHKLGFGTYSTGWVARDERAGRYVAIRIVTSQMKEDPQESIRSLGNEESPWKNLILPVLD